MKAIDSKLLPGNIRLLDLKSQQFKTNLITLYIKRPLNDHEVTMNSLIPSILKMGNSQFKTQAEISKKFQELYGSSFGVGVGKLGEKQILSFKLSLTNDKYLNEKITKDAFSLMMDIILEPLLEDGGFKANYVEIEKDVLKESILSKINNKGSYALERCIEEMCKDEPYSIHEDGKIEDLEAATSKTLYEHYLKVISESEIDIAVTGDVDISEIESEIIERFKFRKSEIVKIPREKIDYPVKEVKNIIEKLDVSQGKIVMGYRTNVDVKSDGFVPLFMYSVILGSGVYSKLFMNIREKHSLCYSINSYLEKIKGIMFITAGIDTVNFDKTIELIKKEVQDMNNGVISENEINFAKKFVRNNLQSLKDSIWSLSDYYYNLSNQGRNESVEEFLGKIDNITVEDVSKISANIQLDTIYFLTKKGE
ncbi:MAG: pitrilysin family protein [Proteocatella sp.]